MKRALFRANRGSPFSVLLLLAASCGSDSAEPAVAHAGRDSAGVAIVEGGPLPARGEGRRLRISPEPRVRIGATVGVPEQQLHRVTDAARLEDGRIVVANAGTQELRYYAADGSLELVAGGEGDGPGEFRSLGLIDIGPGDTVHAAEVGRLRVSVFGPQGQLLRTVSLAEPMGFHRPRYEGRLPGGDYVLEGVATAAAREPREGTVHRDTLHFLRYGPDGRMLGVVTRLSDHPAWVETEAGDRSRSDFSYPLPYATGAPWAVGPRGFNGGEASSYEIRTWEPSGTLRRILRRREPPQPFEDEHLEAYVSQWAGGQADGQRRRWARRVLESARPEFFPLFDRLLVGTGGALWVRRFPLPGDTDRRWDVFRPDGSYEAAAYLPAELQVFQVGPDFVLGLERTEFGVQQVVLHDLVR